MTTISVNNNVYRIEDARTIKGYAGRFTYGWQTVDVRTFAHLAGIITTQVWAPTRLKGSYRHRSQFAGSRWFALDFDDPEVTLASTLKTWCDTTHVIGTTRNHQRQKGAAPPCDRFRILVPWERDIEDIYEYEWNLAQLVEKYGADENSKDAARLFFPCQEIVSIVRDGYLQPVKEAPPAPPKFDYAKVVARFDRNLIPPPFVRKNLTTVIPLGDRNTTLYQLSADLGRLGMGHEEIIERVLNSPTYRGMVISSELRAEIENCTGNGFRKGTEERMLLNGRHTTDEPR